MKTKELKPRYKFYTAGKTLLAKGGTKEDLENLAKEFEGIDKKFIEEFLKNQTKSIAFTQALSAGREEKEAIYNMLDKKIIEECPLLVTFTRGENTEFYEYRDGVYVIMLDNEMYYRIDEIMAQYSLYDYRTSSKNVKDTFKRVESLLARTPKRHFNEESILTRKWYLNLKNGLLDMKTFELKEHTPDYFSVVQAPFSFDPKDECPEFIKFIDKITLSNPTTAQMIQEMFGYCIMEGNAKHKVFYLYGDTARNGKSTTAQILCGLIGWGNVSTLSLMQLAGENSAILTGIIGKQINFSDEISSKYIESSRLTAMSAEGVVQVNPKFKSNFLYKVRAKFLIACNDLPRFKDAQGMKHRMISIPFSYHIPESERIDRYDEILLKKEGSGILNWAIAGAKLLKDGAVFSINDESREDVYDNLMQSNSVYAYLDMNYDFDQKFENIETAETLYGDVGNKDTIPTGYRGFCLAKGIFPVSWFVFARELKRFERETKKVSQRREGGTGDRYYIGLKKKKSQAELDLEKFND